MKKPIISLLALLLSASVFSQALPAPIPRVVFPTTVVGNVVTYGALTADASNAAKFSFGAAANGSVFANTGSSLATAGGGSVNLAVAGTVSKLAVARAVGRFAAKTIPFMTVGSALYDLAKELGFGVVVGSPGSSITKAPSGRFFDANVGRTPSYSSGQELCRAFADRTFGVGSLPDLSYDGMYSCDSAKAGGSVNSGVRQIPADGTQPVPATQQDLDTALVGKNDWSPSSSLGRAVMDALKSGEQADVEPTSITGPATSPGTSSQTVSANDPAVNSSTNPANNPNTSTTTQTQTSNHTYNGPSVTTTTTTTNSTVNNSTGAVTNNTTTTTSPVLPAPSGDIITCGLPGKPPCKIDEAGTPEYDPKKFELDKATLDPASKAQRDSVSSTTDKASMFNPFSEFFLLPTLTTCTPIAMPVVAGQQIASMDVCPGAEWLRGLMGFVWAASGFLFVFRTVQDVI